MKAITVAAAVLFHSSSLIHAEVEAAVIILREGSSTFQESYTIPSGKVFILNAVRNQFHSGDVQARISYQNTLPTQAGSLGWTFSVREGVGGNGLVFLERPLQLAAGVGLRVPTTGVIVSYFGTLVDEGDLYAANVDVELKNPTVSGGMLMAEAHLSSPRPTSLSVTKSETLSTFETDTEAEIIATADPSVKIIKTPANIDKKFIAASASSR